MADIDVLQQLEQAQTASARRAGERLRTEEDAADLAQPWLGKNTAITQAFQSLGKLPAEMRPQVGQTANR